MISNGALPQIVWCEPYALGLVSLEATHHAAHISAIKMKFSFDNIEIVADILQHPAPFSRPAFAIEAILFRIDLLKNEMPPGLEMRTEASQRLHRPWNVLEYGHTENDVIGDLIQQIVGAWIHRQRPHTGLLAEFPPHIVEQHVLDVCTGDAEPALTIEPRQAAGDRRQSAAELEKRSMTRDPFDEFSGR